LPKINDDYDPVLEVYPIFYGTLGKDEIPA